jgi:hypothetical protein
MTKQDNKISTDDAVRVFAFLILNCTLSGLVGLGLGIGLAYLLWGR